jgi:hypothetical protein
MGHSPWPKVLDDHKDKNPKAQPPYWASNGAT